MAGAAVGIAHGAPDRPVSVHWSRGRGWALWKALMTLAGYSSAARPKPGGAREVTDVIADHAQDR